MKYYVYALKYPDGQVFYVGKGTRYRINQHEMEARGTLPISNPHKVNVIRKIWAGGGEIGKEKVYETDNEEEAYRVEKEIIEYYGISNLTNIVNSDDDYNRATKSPDAYTNQASAAIKANSKTWEGFISPFGEEYRNIVNLNEFCRDHNLVYYRMVNVHKGKEDNCKGWRKIGRKSFCEDNYDTSTNRNAILSRTYIPPLSLSIDTLPEDIVYTCF